MTPLLDFLSAHGAQLALGGSTCLAIGSFFVLAVQQPVYRQRLAETTVAAALVWLVLAVSPIRYRGDVDAIASRVNPIDLSRISIERADDLDRRLDGALGWPRTVADQERSKAVASQATPKGLEKTAQGPPEGARSGYDSTSTNDPGKVGRRVAKQDVVVALSPDQATAPTEGLHSQDGETFGPSGGGVGRPRHNDERAPPAGSVSWPAVALLGSATAAALCLIIASMRLRRLVQHCSPPDAITEATWRRLDPPRNARLLVARRSVTPMSFGLLRPTVCIPRSLTQSPSAAVEGVLRHELAHVRHRDAWSRALFNAALPIFALHPLYWLLRRQATFAAELRADAAASQTVGAASYVRSLVDLFNLAGRPERLLAASTVWTSESAFSRRMNMLLNRDRAFLQTISWRWRTLTVVVAAAAVFLTADRFGVVYAQTEKAKTKTTTEVKVDPNARTTAKTAKSSDSSIPADEPVSGEPTVSSGSRQTKSRTARSGDPTTRTKTSEPANVRSSADWRLATRVAESDQHSVKQRVDELQEQIAELATVAGLMRKFESDPEVAVREAHLMLKLHDLHLELAELLLAPTPPPAPSVAGAKKVARSVAYLQSEMDRARKEHGADHPYLKALQGEIDRTQKSLDGYDPRAQALRQERELLDYKRILLDTRRAYEEKLKKVSALATRRDSTASDALLSGASDPRPKGDRAANVEFSAPPTESRRAADPQPKTTAATARNPTSRVDDRSATPRPSQNNPNVKAEAGTTVDMTPLTRWIGEDVRGAFKDVPRDWLEKNLEKAIAQNDKLRGDVDALMKTVVAFDRSTPTSNNTASATKSEFDSLVAENQHLKQHIATSSSPPPGAVPSWNQNYFEGSVPYLRHRIRLAEAELPFHEAKLQHHMADLKRIEKLGGAVAGDSAEKVRRQAELAQAELRKAKVELESLKTLVKELEEKPPRQSNRVR